MYKYLTCKKLKHKVVWQHTSGEVGDYVKIDARLSLISTLLNTR